MITARPNEGVAEQVEWLIINTATSSLYLVITCAMSSANRLPHSQGRLSPNNPHSQVTPPLFFSAIPAPANKFWTL